MHRKARVLSISAVLAACLPLVLTECSYDFTCDRTSAAIVLPIAGNTVALRGRACIKGADSNRPIQIHFDEEMSPPRVRMSIADPVAGTIVSNGQTAVEIAPEQCSEGLVITVESTAPPGSMITGVLVIEAESAEYDHCHVALEVP